jgi:hypothetical protein
MGYSRSSGRSSAPRAGARRGRRRSWAIACSPWSLLSGQRDERAARTLRSPCSPGPRTRAPGPRGAARGTRRGSSDACRRPVDTPAPAPADRGSLRARGRRPAAPSRRGSCARRCPGCAGRGARRRAVGLEERQPAASWASPETCCPGAAWTPPGGLCRRPPVRRRRCA